MGATPTVAIRNPADLARGRGCGYRSYRLSRSPVLESIGLFPESQRRYGLADGSEIRLDVTGGRIEFMGETTWGTIVFGDESAEPLLGVTALESVGIEVDPRNQTLNRLPATRLRGIRAVDS